MKKSHFIIIFILFLSLVGLSCARFVSFTPPNPTAMPQDSPTKIPTTTVPKPTCPIQQCNNSLDLNEPVFITGEIPYTSPFFLDSAAEPFVLLEDQAGFSGRNKDFEFPLAGQAIGAVEMHDDLTLSFTLALPAVPQGTLMDVDFDGEKDLGVQTFGIAYWSNIWGGPFLERRDGTGWSNAYTSTTTDPDRQDEITGGILLVWAPDDQQQFPVGFGEDQLLFTSDDPVASIPAGYNLVDLDEEPFRIYKESNPHLILHEGIGALKDFSGLSYSESFAEMFSRVSREYPFTQEKNIDWNALNQKYSQRIAQVKKQNDFYRALRDFTYEIPDSHIGLSFNPEVFYDEQGGSFGLILTQLTDGRVLVKDVIQGTSGANAGIWPGAEVFNWNGKQIQQALDEVVPYLSPYSTAHSKRLGQLIFLTRYPPYTQISIRYSNPDSKEIIETTLTAEVEYESLLSALYPSAPDELQLPVTGEVLDESGLGYIQLSSFSDDYNLLARLWEHHIKALIDADVPGLIIDLRDNGGGSLSIAMDFAGYFFNKRIPISTNAYFNQITGSFETQGLENEIIPGPLEYTGSIAVLVSPDCVSACEGFAYMLSLEGRAIIVGNFPTAGAYGEVGRGQYKLPGDISMQFPTGRPETPDGKILIEGKGVIPDILVPITEESVFGNSDPVLDAAVKALSEHLK